MREPVTFDGMERSHPQAYAAMCAADTCGIPPAEFYEDSDLCFYLHGGELFSESHDELALHVWRDGAWQELDFSHRPGDET